MRLCREVLHCTVDEMLDRITLDELMDWYAFFRMLDDAAADAAAG